jgi:hypothetical protein
VAELAFPYPPLSHSNTYELSIADDGRSAEIGSP